MALKTSQAVRLRAPVPSDAAAISAIDAEGLATGDASFRAEPHDWRSFRMSFLERGGLALVAEASASEDEAQLLGCAGVSPTSARPVYRGVGEVSVYVSGRVRGRGVGSALLAGLIDASERAGYWTLIAQVFPENAPSLRLHAAHAFRTIGTRERLGRMTFGPFEGRWRDVVMLERRSLTVGQNG